MKMTAPALALALALSGSAIAANSASVVLNLVDPDQCEDLRL